MGDTVTEHATFFASKISVKCVLVEDQLERVPYGTPT